MRLNAGNVFAYTSHLGAKGIALVDIADDETFKSGKEAVEKYGAKCITIHANVTKEDEIERAVAEAVKEFGRIDYAANFAGTSLSCMLCPSTISSSSVPYFDSQTSDCSLHLIDAHSTILNRHTRRTRPNALHLVRWLPPRS